MTIIVAMDAGGPGLLLKNVIVKQVRDLYAGLGEIRGCDVVESSVGQDPGFLLNLNIWSL